MEVQCLAPQVARDWETGPVWGSAWALFGLNATESSLLDLGWFQEVRRG